MNYQDLLAKSNPVAFQIIENAFHDDKISHAYLFSAPKHFKIEIAPLYLIQKLISSKDNLRNPLAFADLTILDGSKELISKESVTNAIEKLQQTSLDEIGKKILYIKNVENGNSSSLNALLKFIEEPAENTFIICTTNNISQVMTTIKSRMQIINLRAIGFESFLQTLIDAGMKKDKAKIVASVCNSKDEALALNDDEEFWNNFNLLMAATAAMVRNKARVYTHLVPLIKKQNYLIISRLLMVFFNDIWRFKNGNEIIFEEDWATIENYSHTKFDFQKAIKALNNFVVSQERNINFDLSKNALCIEIEESHE